MIYKGIDCTPHFKVERIERGLLPGVSNSLYRRNFLRSERQPTQISVDIRLICDTDAELVELKRTVAGFLYSETPQILQLHDDPSRYDMAVLDGDTNFNKLWTTGSTTLKFIVPEGLSYTYWPTTKTIGTIGVEGTFETKPIFKLTLTANLAYVKVANNTTGEFVYVNGPFVSGNIIIIDCQKSLVTVNGNPIMPKVTLDSDFFSLLPGENKLTSNAPGVVEYRGAWL